jgi:hydrogenase/urease accessory protein HupE
VRLARRIARALALAALLAPAAAAAHDAPYSMLELKVGPRGLEGTILAHVANLTDEAGLADPDSLLDSLVATRRVPALQSMLAARLRLEADGAPLTPRWGAWSIQRDQRTLAFHWSAAWSHPPERLRIEGPLFPSDPEHETYFNLYESGALREQGVLTRGSGRVDHFTGDGPGPLAVLRRFLLAGIHHIFIGPDHILFVIGLLLLGGGAMRLLKIVTAFTLAHSVTLALATLGIVSPSPRLVEPVIALSIVAVGLGNLRARPGEPDGRVWVALGFGFIHGFGFASVLREFGLPRQALGLSLFAFNAGVEVGQGCIVALVAPPLALLRSRAPSLTPRVVTVGSLGVAVAGAWWFVERVFLPGR